MEGEWRKYRKIENIELTNSEGKVVLGSILKLVGKGKGLIIE